MLSVRRRRRFGCYPNRGAIRHSHRSSDAKHPPPPPPPPQACLARCSRASFPSPRSPTRPPPCSPAWRATWRWSCCRGRGRRRARRPSGRTSASLAAAAVPAAAARRRRSPAAAAAAARAASPHVPVSRAPLRFAAAFNLAAVVLAAAAVLACRNWTERYGDRETSAARYAAAPQPSATSRRRPARPRLSACEWRGSVAAAVVEVYSRVAGADGSRDLLVILRGEPLRVRVYVDALTARTQGAARCLFRLSPPRPSAGGRRLWRSARPQWATRWGTVSSSRSSCCAR